MRSEAAARRPASNLRGSSLLRNSILVLLATTITISALLPYFLSVQISYESSSNNNDKRQDGTGRLQASNLKDSAATENEGATSNSNEVRQPDYHIVFSTSCTAQQNWESYVFFYHCMRVKQPGTVTRIASGCRHSEATALQQFHEKFIHSMAVHPTQTFALHLTPDYSRVRKTEGKYAYKYMNKPYGLLHWMENGLNLTRSKSKGKDAFVSSPYSESGHHQVHQQLLDGIVILMDPDMILLRPIGHEFSGDHELWIEKPAITKVVHGHPIAQQDGYLTNTWMDLNFSYITGDPSIKPPRRSKGEIHWNTGPPYLATVSDMFQIALLWTDLAPRVVDVHPHLFAEMFGFIIATVMLQLPFSLTKSIVVSTPETHDREGWKFIDSLPDSDICRVPVAATSNSHASNLPVLPTALHYCKRYLLGKVRTALLQ